LYILFIHLTTPYLLFYRLLDPFFIILLDSSILRNHVTKTILHEKIEYYEYRSPFNIEQVRYAFDSIISICKFGERVCFRSLWNARWATNLDIGGKSPLYFHYFLLLFFCFSFLKDWMRSTKMVLL